MVQGYIYRHWIINDKGVEKSYIGQTIQKPTRRWRNGQGYFRCKDTKMKKAIIKYGWENFSHEIVGIVESDTKEQLVLDLDEWEKYYIFKYDSFHNGYNSTTGGDGSTGFKHTDESKKKMKEIKKGTCVGEKNPFYGRKHSEKSKVMIGQSGSKSVVCVTTGEIFDSIKDAQEKYNLSSIGKCCKGKRKSCGKHPETGEKLIWKYYE